MPEPEVKEYQKQKLTLGVNGEVIERARAAGINISELTEKLLTAVTMQPSGSTRDDVESAFTKLFDVMQETIKKYGVWVKVGEIRSYSTPAAKEPILVDEVYLDGDWIIASHDVEYQGEAYLEPRQTTVAETLDYLYEPNHILQNMIEELTKAAEKNKEKLSKLEFALKLVKALSEGEQDKK